MHISVNKRYTQKGKKAGVRSEVIKDLMGHSKVATTLIYVHSSRAAAPDAVARVLVTNCSSEEARRVVEKAG